LLRVIFQLKKLNYKKLKFYFLFVLKKKISVWGWSAPPLEATPKWI
jgi:hypothetical protein